MENIFFLFYLNDSLDLFNLCFFLLMQARLCAQSQQILELPHLLQKHFAHSLDDFLRIVLC